MSCNSTPLQLPVEALQKACPRLQVSMPYLPPLAIRRCQPVCSLSLLTPRCYDC